MNKSYKELRKRQIILGIISLLAIVFWGIIVKQSGGLLDDYLLIGIGVFGVLSVIAIVQTRKPILCAHCNTEITEVFMKAEALNKHAKYCPFCGGDIG